MATSHAETGVIADKAGAPAEGAGAENSTATTASAPAAGIGAADVAGDPAPGAPKPEEKPAKSVKKEKKSDEKKAKSAEKVADAAKKLVDTALDEVAKDKTSEKLKKVKMVRSHPDFAYHAGEEGELPADKAKDLIEGGFAEAVTK